jgi:hypothetical protein
VNKLNVNLFNSATQPSPLLEAKSKVGAGVNLFLILLFSLLFLISIIFFSEDFLLKTAYADEGSDSDEQDKPKLDKGKGKAIGNQTNEDISLSLDPEDQKQDKPKLDKGKGKAVDNQVYDYISISSGSESEQNRKSEDKKYMESLDYKLAMYLQKEEEESWSYHSMLSDYEHSSPSVVSTEIHSDDSDTTKKRKLTVRQIEKELLLEQQELEQQDLEQKEVNSRKRKYSDSDDEDVKPETSKKK